MQDESVIKFLQKQDKVQMKKLLMLMDDRPNLARLKQKLIEITKAPPD